MRSGRRYRRTRAAVVGSAAALAVPSVVLLATALRSAPTTSATAVQQTLGPMPSSTPPPSPTGTASPQTSEAPGSEPSGELSPGAGRAAMAHHRAPAAAVTDLRTAVRDLTVARPGYIGPVSATIVGYQLDSWRSPQDFTVMVALDLHFATTNTMAWNEGANTRFIRFTTRSADNGYQLSWASSPF